MQQQNKIILMGFEINLVLYIGNSKAKEYTLTLFNSPMPLNPISFRREGGGAINFVQSIQTVQAEPFRLKSCGFWNLLSKKVKIQKKIWLQRIFCVQKFNGPKEILAKTNLGSEKLFCSKDIIWTNKIFCADYKHFGVQK